MAFSLNPSAPGLLQSTALIATLAGVVYWSWLLLAPVQSSVPLPETTTPQATARSPAQQWFSNQPQEVRINVSGVMAGARGAVAIISVNDRPARSYLTGELLTNDVRLVAIESDGVVIEQGTEQKRFKVTRLSGLLELPSLLRR
ncbi:type II secretion system protein C (GspC) [Pseudomonas syringae]|uniref:type II secretion system protein N n=1 Tax=Pseudomonas syringae TaxID=317 RepID=UPI000894CE9F|nr:type II secretion system protein N [Pseudomonas syringae]SDX56143.1 type II secretion system protein C (GspC) [Pseudomonas syringae]SFM67009.1 type II secretion system protein C (GspC) [Pseudomonas syringae]